MHKNHQYKESVRKNNFDVINCQSCGYWHVYPMPAESELASYYGNKYYENLKNDRTMVDKVDDPDGFYRIQYEDRLRHVEKVFIPGLPKSVIDIGAGYGDFLAFMRCKGWQIQGVEPSRQVYERIMDKDLNIKLVTVDNICEAKLEPASLVTLNNTLEHLRDPQRVLEIVKKDLLLPDGLLSVIVPNDFSILQNILMQTILRDTKEKQFYWLAPPEHLNYWSFETLEAFLEKCGFRNVYVISDFPMELFPLMGEDYISNSQVGRLAHLKRVRFERLISESGYEKFKDLLFHSFANIKIGRDIHAIAKVNK